MSVTAAFVAHEIRTQTRSLRFRVLAVVYALAGSAPAALVYARRQEATLGLGSSSYAAETMALLPLLTAVLAFLISLDAILREQDEGAWSTVSLTGISSAGYLLRRWISLQAVLLPLTAGPVLAAAGAAAAGGGSASLVAGPFLGPWLMHVVPVALGISALGMGLGTVAGGALNSFLLTAAVLILVPGIANELLGRFGVRLASPFNWLQLQNISWLVSRIVGAYAPDGRWVGSFPVEVTGAPYDPWMAGEQYLVIGAVPLALAAGALGFAVRYLRRTRPNVRPWRISPEHPLRTFLAMVSRLRERYTPDPKPSRADLLALGLALLAAAGFAALIVERALRFQDLGRERFASEKSEGPAPTPPEVTPGRWRVEGTVGPGRKVDLAVAMEMRNQGTAPRGHLAFTLNPSLRIAEVKADAGSLRLSRRWDRLAMDLTPPIPPGGSREIRFRLAGAPEETRFNLKLLFYGFHRGFGDHLNARFHRDLEDLSRSYRAPAVSAGRIDLEASDLFPVPRYEPWKLLKDPELNRITVAEETFRPQADISLSLAAPRGVFLADACGERARNGRLASRCRLPLADFLVAGGRYQALSVPAGGATVAVFPSHQTLGELHLGFLARGTLRLEEAWPGLGDLRRTVVLEWPDENLYRLDSPAITYWRPWDWGELTPPVEVRGSLLLLREWTLLRSEPIKPDSLMAEVVAGRLDRRRAMAPRDSYFFHRLFRELALQRLGLGPETGALVTGLRTGMEGAVRVPPPEGPYSNNYWRLRFPALVAALRYRMGEETLRLALDDLLSREGGKPLAREELYALLKERSETPIGRMIEDFFVQGALPEPVLEGVAFRRAGEGWQVTGKMLNQGTGEALCKIVLTTNLGPVETFARAEGGQAGSFSFSTSHRPQAVLLDPDRECHRLAPPTDRVFFEGAS